MADQSISQLPIATTLTGDELTVVVQNGITKQTQVADIANAVAPGKFIDYLYFDTGSDLIVVYTDSTTQNLGPIPGYIAAEIAPNGHLILTNSTGGTTDAGSVFATLSQTFITANNESSTLPNSQQLIAGAGVSLTQGTNSMTIAVAGSSGSLNGAGTGIIVKDTSTSVVARTLTSTAGISITNPDGIAGNPVISPASKLADIQNLATTGILAVVGGTTVVDRNIVGTASQIDVVNGDGSGNPTISINDNPVLPGTGSVTLPQGDTADRPGNLPGQLRFNTELDVFEGQNNSGGWQVLALGGGVTSITLGTGLTGSPNPITSTGTISITATGVTVGTYGSTTQVPVFAVNAQGQITSVTNTTISPSGIGAVASVSGTANEITASGTTNVTLSLPNALTFTGKTVTGGTLTGVSINGATNTLSNIANASLSNSQITLGTTNISLGGTSLAPVGLTSVTVTQDPTTNFQLATKQYVDTVAATGIHYHEAVYVESPNTAGNLNATYANGGTNINIIDIANGSDLTFFGTPPAIGDQLLTSTGNGLVAGTQYWVVAAVGAARQISLTYGGAPITSLTNGSVTIPSRYNDGVGATLTNAGTQVALTVDSVLMTVGKRVLIYNQTNAFENGVYDVTVVGDGSTNWVLTRSADANTYSPYSANSLGQGDAFFVQAGATGAGETYVVTTTGSIFFGQTNIAFAQISAALTYSAGTGLTLTGTTFSISNTAVTAGAYGSASSVGTFTVNAQGQLTLAGSTAISIPASAINTAIPNSGLANSSITINGSVISLGGSVSVGTVTSVAATGGTGINVTGGPITTSGTLTITNTAPDQTVVLNNGTGISVSGTYPNFTITNTAPSSGGTVTSVSGTGTVSGLTLSGTVTTTGSLTLGGTLDLSAPPAIGGTTPNAITGTTITATNYVGISGGTF